MEVEELTKYDEKHRNKAEEHNDNDVIKLEIRTSCNL